MRFEGDRDGTPGKSQTSDNYSGDAQKECGQAVSSAPDLRTVVDT